MQIAVMKKLLKCLSWLICIVVFCAVAEWYVRSRGYVCEQPVAMHIAVNRVFSPDMGWERSGPEKVLNGEAPPDSEIYISILADKSRASRRFVRPTTKIKVLVLGCSFTYGIGVEDKDTYVWLLNERFPKVTFDNFAQDGYGTLQCLLREEKILNNNRYDYVIYAAINDHLRRNISYSTWQVDEASDKSIAFNNLLKKETQMWYYPIAFVNADGSLGIRRADYHWFGDEHSAIINTLKRLFMFNVCYQVTHNLDKYEHYSREIYWRILYRMDQIAREHGSKFATICLTNDDEKSLFPPSSKEMESWNKGHSCTMSLPLPFAYTFVTDGHEGEEDQPKFHVAGKMNWHGTPIVHRNWAKHISAWFEGWYKEQGDTEK